MRSYDHYSDELIYRPPCIVHQYKLAKTMLDLATLKQCSSEFPKSNPYAPQQVYDVMLASSDQLWHVNVTIPSTVSNVRGVVKPNYLTGSSVNKQRCLHPSAMTTFLYHGSDIIYSSLQHLFVVYKTRNSWHILKESILCLHGSGH